MDKEGGTWLLMLQQNMQSRGRTGGWRQARRDGQGRLGYPRVVCCVPHVVERLCCLLRACYKACGPLSATDQWIGLRATHMEQIR
eukprot:scaffold230921_cov17-Tisochrysis_lutea.AAC.1